MISLPLPKDCSKTSKVGAMEYDRPLKTQACVVALVRSYRGHGWHGTCSLQVVLSKGIFSLKYCLPFL